MKCPIYPIVQPTPILYIPGEAYEVLPNVYVDVNTKIYNKECSLKHKFQQLAFKWASVYVNSITDLDGSLELLKEISYADSQLYFPSQFGYITNQQQIIDDVTLFSKTYAQASVWFPANAWVYDKKLKCGVVGSNAKIEYYYNFCVEVQFRQTQIVSGNPISVATNDCWSFFIDESGCKFFQIKEWLDGRVRRIHPQRTPDGNKILILDTNNINLIPFPPVEEGVTINSIIVIANATP